MWSSTLPQSRNVHLPKPMMHNAYSPLLPPKFINVPPISTKIKNFLPSFPENLSIFPYFCSIYVFCLPPIMTMTMMQLMHHDAFKHHALRIVASEVCLKQPNGRSSAWAY